ncbi:MAG TPA: hypothetical protein VHM70_09640 [Polyangiaceae bacterium]|nr:hypothetical protein [Polyangiaceae bacterium]
MAGPVVERWEARRDPGLQATLSGLAPLLYELSDTALEGLDLPPFVRAASALRRWGNRRVVIQDDVSALALSVAGGKFEPVLLPGAGRRRFESSLGNKAAKLDLEAATVLPDGRLLVFGSGSTSARERVVLLADEATGQGVRIVNAEALYAELRAAPEFAGSELNIEGALVMGSRLCLVQRGNGAERSGVQPIDAIGELQLSELLSWLDAAGPVPRLRRIRQVRLGEHEGARLTFTDAAALDAGTLIFLASAERSPNTYDDGVVTCAALGVIDHSGVRLTLIRDPKGALVRLKLEGIEPSAQPGTFDVVIDADDAAKPALGGTLELAPWPLP